MSKEHDLNKGSHLEGKEQAYQNIDPMVCFIEWGIP